MESKVSGLCQGTSYGFTRAVESIRCTCAMKIIRNSVPYAPNFSTFSTPIFDLFDLFDFLQRLVAAFAEPPCALSPPPELLILPVDPLRPVGHEDMRCVGWGPFLRGIGVLVRCIRACVAVIGLIPLGMNACDSRSLTLHR